MTLTTPKKGKLGGILAILVYLAAGLLLLIHPDIMGEVMHWTLTAVLAGYAVIQAVKYFRAEQAEAAKEYRLATALLAATLALLACLDPSWVSTRLWGVLILCGGYLKFQTAWDFYRLGHRNWWWIMIAAGVSLVLGVLILTDVISANLVLWVGIMLLVEAALDIAVQIMVA